MKTETFITLNIVLLGFFALVFLLGRTRSKDPSKLNVTASSRNAQRAKSSAMPEPTLGRPQSLPASDQLTTQFMYNGHNWEAYEVLGLAKGSSIEQVKLAFEKSLQKNNPASHDFLKMALSVILTDFKNRGYKP